MKKQSLLALPFLLSFLSLSLGCSEKEATISLYDADSRLVFTSFDE